MEQTLLTIHLLSLVVGMGGGVANAVAGSMAAGADPAAAMTLGKLQSRIGDIGFVAIVLLWISGIWLVLGYHGGFAELPSGFTTKFVGVVGLSAAVVAMHVVKRSAMRAGRPPNAGTMKLLGKIALLSATFTVAMAVVTFNH